MKVSSDITYRAIRASRSWWSRSILCNPQPRKSKATISIFPLSTSPLAQTVFCMILFTHYLICFLTSLQLWVVRVVPPSRIRQASWHHRSQWCRKVKSPPAYRYARVATFLYPHTFPSSLWNRKYGIFHRYSTSMS
jgi:hypothetical protein